MVVWNDLDPDETLKIYDSGVEIRSDEERNVLTAGYRIGDINSPRISRAEPLATLVNHFYRVIGRQEKSLVDGAAGLEVVALLERTQRALDATFKKITNLQMPKGTGIAV
jgi:hypothetical protein